MDGKDHKFNFGHAKSGICIGDLSRDMEKFFAHAIWSSKEKFGWLLTLGGIRKKVVLRAMKQDEIINKISVKGREGLRTKTYNASKLKRQRD